MTPNAGFSAGLAKRSKVARLAYAWKGAQKKSLRERSLNPLQAVKEARDLAELFGEKLEEQGAAPGDLAIALVFAEKENSGKMAGSPALFRPKDPKADHKDLDGLTMHLSHRPIGFVFCVFDRERNEFIAHSRPLSLDAAASALLESVVEIAATNGLQDWRGA